MATAYNRSAWRNYLRVRGEYLGLGRLWLPVMELPPRARRIPGFHGFQRFACGTTSACAENTEAFSKTVEWIRNYLRVRGEYGVFVTQGKLSLELPPRARRIRGELGRIDGSVGTTSACAENTAEQAPNPNQKWNYLRVRGEYNQAKAAELLKLELPPRARRIPLTILPRNDKNGTTSACAENTRVVHRHAPNLRNYLRVRGEYLSALSRSVFDRELPPRARRIHTIGLGGNMPTGTTSACAENTDCGG